MHNYNKHRPLTEPTNARSTYDDSYTYRVAIISEREPNATPQISVTCFNLEPVDYNVNGLYDSPDALPRWMQERLAVLMMTKAEYPTEEIPDVGRRITSSVFWVFAPKVE
jgi:kynureninase